MSALSRVRLCRRAPHGRADTVGVVCHGGDRVGFTGLQTCASVHACPLCSARILAERTDDLVRLVDAHHAAGGRLLLITTTMPHDRSTDLAAALDAILGAWSRLRPNGTVRRRQDAMGWLGCVRRFEITDGDNGWHPHVHGLGFVGDDVSEAQVSQLRDDIASVHERAIVAAGFDAPSDEHGVTVKLLDLAEGLGAAAAYLTKGSVTESTEDARTAALELTAGTSKRGRRGSRTPWQILGDLLEHGDAVDQARWLEYEAATKGRRLVTTTPALRARYAPEVDERTDEELAELADADATPIGEMSFEEWTVLRQIPGAPHDLVRVLSLLAGAVAQGADVDLARELDRQLQRLGARPPDDD